MTEPNIVFMGTPEFSVPAMNELHNIYGLKAIVTVPDKPSGRGLKLTMSPVKEAALQLNIPVLQPENLKSPEFIDELSKYNPDIICVIAFRILPKVVYEMAKIASFNVHASILPKYRGAAPINHAIINGDTKSGLSTFILQEKVDTGNILLQDEVEFKRGTTAGQLHDILMLMTPAIAVRTCEMLMSGKYTPLKQNDAEASPAPKIFPEDCFLDWNLSRDTVLNRIWGLSPYPGARTRLNGQLIKIIYAKKHEYKSLNHGDYIIRGSQFLVGCNDGSIELTDIIPEGKKEMKASEFIKGYRGESSGCLG